MTQLNNNFSGKLEDFLETCKDKYQVILADPPWEYNNRGRGAASNSYNLMSIEQMKSLPVQNICDKDCVLFMWTTFPQIQEALDLIKSWGFIYKTGASWQKLTRNGRTAFGPGFFFRSASELLLLAVKGKPKLKTKDNRNFFSDFVNGHSRKPDYQYTLIERMFDGPYVEFFARRPRNNWTSVGDMLTENDGGLFNFVK